MSAAAAAAAQKIIATILWAMADKTEKQKLVYHFFSVFVLVSFLFVAAFTHSRIY